MAEPIAAVEIPSDADDLSPVPLRIKNWNKGVERGGTAPILILDDDPSPQKQSVKSTPCIVPETPLLDPSPSIVKCTGKPRSRSIPDKLSGITGFICLESGNEFVGSFQHGSHKDSENMGAGLSVTNCLNKDFFRSASALGKSFEFVDVGPSSPTKVCALKGIDNEPFQSLTRGGFVTENDTVVSLGHSDATSENENDLMWNLKQGTDISQLDSVLSHLPKSDNLSPQRTSNIIQIMGDSPTNSGCPTQDTVSQVQSDDDQGYVMLEQLGDIKNHKDNLFGVEMGKHKDEEAARKQQLKEEKRLKREHRKLLKEALKAEVAELKKLEKEKKKWKKGKFSLKSIVAEIDTKVVEIGAIGGHLLTRFAEKGLTFRVTKNPIERSILWKMCIPNQISQPSLSCSDVPYVVLVYEADEFCNLITSESLMDCVSRVRNHFPSYTVCYLTNKLMAYINRREQGQYKNPSNVSSWRRPPVEEVLSMLTTHFVRVHSRQCIDEAELAEHVVDLTCSLAMCQFRKKLSKLSVTANGSHIPKDFIDKNLIKKSVWLKVLTVIPKVQPRFAVAIWKKYPTMRSLLDVYWDPCKSVHEKEFLLKDLTTEGLLGNEGKRVGEVCSRRVYRILMAQNGNIATNDAEDGADFFLST